jgi:hypothetical protein
MFADYLMNCNMKSPWRIDGEAQTAVLDTLAKLFAP